MQITAHRGFGGAYPENTASALRRAAEQADAVEVDVRRCGSGELVASHFDHLRLATDGVGKVSDRTLSELRPLKVAGSDEGIPTLAEALDAMPPETEVVLDLKGPGIAADALSIARGFDHELTVASFYADALWETRDRDPEATLAYNFDVRMERNMITARLLDCKHISVHWTLCLATDVVERAHEEGVAVRAWSVGSRPLARALRWKGVDGLFTSKPDVIGD